MKPEIVPFGATLLECEASALQLWEKLRRIDYPTDAHRNVQETRARGLTLLPLPITRNSVAIEGNNVGPKAIHFVWVLSTGFAESL